ncbi:hypothetical protein [uncultured Microbacterium sp.]|uniref:hypothetical protein n=1 Tax=uncultured Microbacterium sp. TaxID=191216 RepID=UPI002599ACE9|nr:hypothetical protein [uncultured Microbacterium sp.]
MKRIGAVATLGLVLLLAACSNSSAPPVETITPSADSSPETTPTPEAERGSRENPLSIGEQRKLTEDSMWSVGADAASQVGAGYIALPIHITFDWDAAAAQGAKIEEGVDPSMALWIEYVTSSGRSYDIDETYIELPNQLYQVGTVYPPLTDLSANYVVTLPDAEIAGGVWKVANSNGDSVFIAAQ